MKTKKKIAILASGGGSNLQAILDAMKEGNYPAEAVLVFSNKKEAQALKRAETAGVAAFYLHSKNYPDNDAYDEALLKILLDAAPDFVCLAGYMRILSPMLVRAFPGRILNIHPSLLPKHGGKGMYGSRVHEAVLAAGDVVSGATVHWVDQGVDTGQIILQGAVPVEKEDTAEILAARVLKLEHRLYPEAILRVCAKKA